MREIRQSGSEGGARFNPSFLPLSPVRLLPPPRSLTVFWSARGRAQRRRRFGRARRGKPTHSQSGSQSVPLQAVRNLGILNEEISAP